MKKALFFPGTGYTYREELFKHIRNKLEKEGWTVVPLDYSAIPFKPIKTVAEAGDIALGYTICALQNKEIDKCEDVLFVSKSLGCISDLKYASLLNIYSKHVLLTPTKEVLDQISTYTDIICAVIGDEEPLMNSQELVNFGQEHEFPVLIKEQTGHSLKTENVEITRQITSDIVAFVIDKIKKMSIKQ